MKAAGVHVMAKAPVPGRVNTRLEPALGRAGCARLARRLLARTLAVARDAGVGPVTLWAAGWRGHPALREAARRHGVELRAQRGRGLGERMEHVVRAGLAAGRFPILVGTDCPGLAAGDLRETAAALAEGWDAVLGPAGDGGYYLIGLRAPRPALFRNMDWGGDGVLEETGRRLRRLRLAAYRLGERADLDRPADLGGWSPFEAGLRDR